MVEFSSSQFQTLFAYHWHTIGRLLEGAGKLSAVEYRDNPGYSHGSVHDLLFHLLRTDQSWRLALQTGRQVSPITPRDYPDLYSLKAGFEAEQSAWQELLDGLSAAEIENDIQLSSWRGEEYSVPRWRILQHLVLHGMQHGTEISQLLTSRGHSPGDIDFIFFD